MSLLIKVLKISIGSTVAILIAYALHLDYALAAGIITLLTVYDTKKETLTVALKRGVVFVEAYVIAWVCFFIFSYTPEAFGVFLLIFTASCFFFQMQEAIAMNAVLATHYLLEQSMSVSMFRNEALLFFIGAGIGVILNLYIPKNVKTIKQKQKMIEIQLKEILINMSKDIVLSDQKEKASRLEELKEHIEFGLHQAYQNMQNSLFQETKYYISYMEMRKKQYGILKTIEEKIATLNMVTVQAKEIADFIQQIAYQLSESQNTKNLFVLQERLLDELKNAALPQTREEFENRAILYMILMDFREFLRIKKDFIDQLSVEQKNIYWDSYQEDESIIK